VKRYRIGAHTKHDLKVHLVWIPKYRKKILTGPAAVRARDLIRQIVMEHDLQILSGKVSRDHIHVFPPAHQQNSAKAERDEFKGAPSGISTSPEAAMGQARLGPRVLGCELPNHNGRDG